MHFVHFAVWIFLCYMEVAMTLGDMLEVNGIWTLQRRVLRIPRLLTLPSKGRARKRMLLKPSFSLLDLNYSQPCLSRICWDWKNSFDLEKIRLMRGLKTIEYKEKRTWKDLRLRRLFNLCEFDLSKVDCIVEHNLPIAVAGPLFHNMFPDS